MPGRKASLRLFAALIALAGLLAACTPRITVSPTPSIPTIQAGVAGAEGADAESPEDVAQPDRAVRFHGQIVLPWVDPAEYGGEIRLTTTPSVQALAATMAERFQDEGFDGQISLEPGTATVGVKTFCLLQRADVLLMARPLTPAEKEKCTQNGRTPLELRVGLDAVVIIVAEANPFAEDLTPNELRQAFSTATTWQDLRPDWPPQPILRLSPSPESDTFAVFVQNILDGNAESLLNATRLTFTDDPKALMEQVAASPYAIGFLGFSPYQDNEGQVRALSLNHISPWQAGEDPAYPLLRPVMLYTTAQTLQSQPQLAAFLNFFLMNIDEGLDDAGQFSLGTEELNQAKAAWLQALGYEVP